MYSQRTVLLLLSLFAASTESFGVVRPARSAATTLRFNNPTTTSSILRAEESDDDNNDNVAEEAPAAKEKKGAVATDANDILNSPDFLKRKLEVLKSDLDKAKADLEEAQARLEAGKAEWGAQIDDLANEYKNIQSRMNTQSNASDDQATMQVARQMLDVLDNFDRAFGAVTAETESEREIEAAYRQAYDDILAVFEKLGIEQVDTIGNEFNYEWHQAVMSRPSEEYEEGIVCEEYAKGFKIGDTLIRAAMVAVAA